MLSTGELKKKKKDKHNALCGTMRKCHLAKNAAPALYGIKLLWKKVFGHHENFIQLQLLSVSFLCEFQKV